MKKWNDGPLPILRVADFFSGTHSWTKPFEQMVKDGRIGELRVYSVDNNPRYTDTTTAIKDFLSVTREEVIDHLGGRPDVILASPPCTTFSVASLGHHWGRWPDGSNWRPKTSAAVVGKALSKHTLDLIEQLAPRFFWIENPRGGMRKMPWMEHLQRETVWFCQYGPTKGVLRAKPTDLWGVWPASWKPRAQCKNGNPECDHERAPRGAKTGTQGLKNNADRSMIPQELTTEIAEAVLQALLFLQPVTPIKEVKASARGLFTFV